jgi:hypothetical protein
VTPKTWLDKQMLPRERKRRLILQCGAAGLTASVLGARAQDSGAKERDLVNLHDYQAAPGSDWTAALNQACASARRVYIPAGEYVVRAATWPSDTEIFGDGERTVLRVPADANYVFTAEGGPERARNVRKLYMHDLQLRGSSDIDGFSEFKHLVSINGVSGVRFVRVLFRGFRGDGLYVGAGNRDGTERHNSDVQVLDCVFDGINRANRNGITVIDCDGFRVAGCRFKNMTMPQMPGAIDIEPNRNPYHVVRNIVVSDNNFSQIGGNVGVVAVYVPAEVRAAPVNVTVERNSSDNYVGSGAFFFYNDNRKPPPDGIDNNVRLNENKARNGASPFTLRSGRGFVVSGNRFSDFTHPAYIGYALPATTVEKLTFLNNELLRTGSSSSAGMAVYNAADLRFDGNVFADCGNAGASTASAILFARGRSAGVHFEGNTFSTTSSRRLIAIRKDAAHVFDPASNRFAGNRLNGLTNFFQAVQ